MRLVARCKQKYLVVLHTMINYSVESYGLFGDEREVGSFTSVGHKGVDGG
ncbi:hypothetical protein ACLSM5_000279 [Campylobacter coli]